MFYIGESVHPDAQANLDTVTYIREKSNLLAVHQARMSGKSCHEGTTPSLQIRFLLFDLLAVLVPPCCNSASQVCYRFSAILAAEH